MFSHLPVLCQLFPVPWLPPCVYFSSPAPPMCRWILSCLSLVVCWAFPSFLARCFIAVVLFWPLKGHIFQFTYLSAPSFSPPQSYLTGMQIQHEGSTSCFKKAKCSLIFTYGGISNIKLCFEIFGEKKAIWTNLTLNLLTNCQLIHAKCFNSATQGAY